jgi:hypothetical protein
MDINTAEGKGRLGSANCRRHLVSGVSLSRRELRPICASIPREHISTGSQKPNHPAQLSLSLSLLFPIVCVGACLLGLEEENGAVSEVEVDEVFRF